MQIQTLPPFRTILALTGIAAVALLVSPGPAQAARVDKKAASHLKLAQNYYDAGRLGEALSTVEKAIDEDKKYVQAHQLRGMILYGMGEMDGALEEFDRTLQLDKDYTDARIWRGSTLVNVGREADAMAEFERALEDLTYPWPERIHGSIGNLYRHMGRREEALQSLRKAVTLNPSYARGYYWLGMTYDDLGKEDEALRAYQDALVGMEESPDLNLRLGMALLRSGNRAKAREHLEKVITLSPDGPAADRARDEIRKIQGDS